MSPLISHNTHTHTLTQAPVGHHDVQVAVTLAALLAPGLDADRLVRLNHVGDMELRVHLENR